MTAIEPITVASDAVLAGKSLFGDYFVADNAIRCGSSALRKAISEKVWDGVGKNARGFCAAFNLASRNAGEVHRAYLIYAMCSLGNGFDFEIFEEGENLVVGRTTKCPFKDMIGRSGLAGYHCGQGHRKWGETVVGVLNSNMTFTLTRTMLDGYPHCEWVVERKNFV